MRELWGSSSHQKNCTIFVLADGFSSTWSFWKGANPGQTTWSCKPSNLRSWWHSVYRVVLIRKAYGSNIRALRPIVPEIWGQVILRSDSMSLFLSLFFRSNILFIWTYYISLESESLEYAEYILYLKKFCQKMCLTFDLKLRSSFDLKRTRNFKILF